MQEVVRYLLACVHSSHYKLTWQPTKKEEALVNLGGNLHTYLVENIQNKSSQQVE